MWNTAEDYLEWLYKAYEEFKNARHVYKRTRIFYNKPYWDRHFKDEIKRMEQQVEISKRIKMECEIAA
jgi:hypothetical protein